MKKRAARKKRYVIRDKKYTIRRLALLVLAALLVAGAVITAVFIARGCGVALSMRTLPFDSSVLRGGTGDGILYVRGGKLNFYSFTDENNNFSRELQGTPEKLVGSQGLKAIYSSRAIQIIDAPFNIELDGTILMAKCGGAHLAVYKQRADGNGELRIYGKTGQQVYQIDYAAGAFVDYGFSEENGSVLWTMETYVESGTPRTTITTYDLNRMSATGVISVQGQLVEKVFFTQNSVFVVGTESLIRYSASGNREQYRVQLYGYRALDVSLEGDSPTLLLTLRNSDGNISTARLLTVKERAVADEAAVTVLLPEDTFACYTSCGRLIAIAKNSVTVYSADGAIIETRKLETPITGCEKLDEKHILLERSGECTLITLD